MNISIHITVSTVTDRSTHSSHTVSSSSVNITINGRSYRVSVDVDDAKKTGLNHNDGDAGDTVDSPKKIGLKGLLNHTVVKKLFARSYLSNVRESSQLKSVGEPDLHQSDLSRSKDLGKTQEQRLAPTIKPNNMLQSWEDKRAPLSFRLSGDISSPYSCADKSSFQSLRQLFSLNLLGWDGFRENAGHKQAGFAPAFYHYQGTLPGCFQANNKLSLATEWLPIWYSVAEKKREGLTQFKFSHHATPYSDFKPLNLAVHWLNNSGLDIACLGAALVYEIPVTEFAYPLAQLYWPLPLYFRYDERLRRRLVDRMLARYKVKGGYVVLLYC